MSNYAGWDKNGQIYTFDFWCMRMGWDGGTIHEAFRYFQKMPMHEKDSFCGALADAVGNGQIKDLENGFAAQFTKMRLGGSYV